MEHPDILGSRIPCSVQGRKTCQVTFRQELPHGLPGGLMTKTHQCAERLKTRAYSALYRLFSLLDAERKADHNGD